MTETIRDPSHVRNYTETEWREIVGAAGLEVIEVQLMRHTFDFPAWLERTGCHGGAAERVRMLWGERVDRDRLTLDKIAIRAATGR